MLQSSVGGLLAAMFCFIPAALCAAQADAVGAKDHPLFSSLPGYRIEVYQDRNFDIFEFEVGREKTVTIEGRFYRISYYRQKEAKAASGPAIIRSY